MAMTCPRITSCAQTPKSSIRLIFPSSKLPVEAIPITKHYNQQHSSKGGRGAAGCTIQPALDDIKAYAIISIDGKGRRRCSNGISPSTIFGRMNKRLNL